jgi:hypothetical protein
MLADGNHQLLEPANSYSLAWPIAELLAEKAVRSFCKIATGSGKTAYMQII